MGAPRHPYPLGASARPPCPLPPGGKGGHILPRVYKGGAPPRARLELGDCANPANPAKLGARPGSRGLTRREAPHEHRNQHDTRNLP